MKTNPIKTLLLTGVLITLLSFDIPDGWIVAGSQPKKYEMGIDKGKGQNGKNAATIKSVSKKIKGFGTLMQYFLPEKYLGKRIRMSGYMKSKDVGDWAGLWIRVDQAGSENPLSFDNMFERSVKGTSEWMKYDLVVDVPSNASNIAFGALLSGTGQIWFDSFSFEIVDKTIPLTGTYRDFSFPLQEPANLSFED